MWLRALVPILLADGRASCYFLHSLQSFPYNINTSNDPDAVLWCIVPAKHHGGPGAGLISHWARVAQGPSSTDSVVRWPGEQYAGLPEA